MGESGDWPGWVEVAPGVHQRVGSLLVDVASRSERVPMADRGLLERRPRRPAGLARAVLLGLLVVGICTLGYLASRPVRVDAVEGIGLGAGAPPSAGPWSTAERSARAAAPPDPAATGGSASPVDWWGVLAELDRRRADALAARDPFAVAGYAREGSPAWQADIETIARLTDGGVAPVGMRTRVVAIEQAEASPEYLEGGAARLVLVDERSAYDLVDPMGERVREVPGTDPRRWQVELAHVASPAPDPGWRLTQVVPLP